MGDWYEDALRHKYDPLPDDGPRHRKKSRKRHVRSDHKHQYEKVAIDANLRYVDRNGLHSFFAQGLRCKVCGRMKDTWFTHEIGQHNVPDGMRVFKLADIFEVLRSKEIGDEMEVKRNEGVFRHNQGNT